MQRRQAEPLDAAARDEVAENYAELLASEYAYADKGTAMAAAIRANVKAGKYDGISSPQDFAAALEADARALSSDRHLRVGFGGQPMQMRRGGPPSPEMLAQLRRQNGAIPEVRILDGNIGYLVVNSQLPIEAAKDAIGAAFAFLHNTDAMILDLRANGGGSGYPAYWMSYFSEGPPYVVNTVHWRKDDRVQEFKTSDVGDASYGKIKPVFVLTSRWTFSAAEELAYDLQSFKRGIVVGETTGGGANPSAAGGMAPLGHGFFANVPTGYVVNPATKTNWEGVGVKPDVAASAEEALGKAWSLAADKLRSSTSDPQSGAALDVLSAAKLELTTTSPTTRQLDLKVMLNVSL